MQSHRHANRRRGIPMIIDTIWRTAQWQGLLTSALNTLGTNTDISHVPSSKSPRLWISLEFTDLYWICHRIWFKKTWYRCWIYTRYVYLFKNMVQCWIYTEYLLKIWYKCWIYTKHLLKFGTNVEFLYWISF